MGGFVARDASASVAFMDYDISLFRVGLDPYRAQYAAAGVRSVSGVYINVKRAEAERAVISRGVAERENLFSAILADESAIVFLESLFFHNHLPTQNFLKISDTTASETSRPSSSEIAEIARSTSDATAS